MISIIIPTLNESETINPCLIALQDFRQQGHEIIVVDGGSNDDTIAHTRGLCDQLINTCRGRALQMNAGAAASQGDSLLFLHADTRLPTDAEHLINRGLMDHDWGHFNIRLDDNHFIFRAIETSMNWRSRLTHIATGDQALFIRRQLFDEIHGFPAINIMEDIAICKRLKNSGHRPFLITAPATTSCRRWRQYGILRTILLMWRLRLAYFLGANPARLSRHYPS